MPTYSERRECFVSATPYLTASGFSEWKFDAIITKKKKKLKLPEEFLRASSSLIFLKGSAHIVGNWLSSRLLGFVKLAAKKYKLS